VFLRDMGETPEGPMPKKKAKKGHEPEWGVPPKLGLKYFYTDYEAVVSLVDMLRGLGVYLHISKCPRCGAEGTLSVVVSKHGYRYLVVRHRDGSTHGVARTQITDEMFKELCEVKKDLEYILKRYSDFERGGVKFCEERRQ